MWRSPQQLGALRILPSSHTNPIFIALSASDRASLRRRCVLKSVRGWNQKSADLQKEREEAEKAYGPGSVSPYTAER